MASAREWGGEPDPQDVFSKAIGQQPSAERKYIGIIMFPAVSSGSFIIAQGCADAGKFVGDDGGADARAVDNNPANRLAPCDHFGDLTCDVRVIGRLLLMHANVMHVESKLFEDWLELFFERKAAMIGSECDGLSGRSSGRKLIGGNFHQLDTAFISEITRRWRDDGAGNDLEFAQLRDIGCRDDFSH